MSETKRGPGRPKNPDGPMKIVNVRMDGNMHDKISEIADTYQIGMSEFIRNAITFYYNFLRE